jgi:hypothetical protein
MEYCNPAADQEGYERHCNAMEYLRRKHAEREIKTADRNAKWSMLGSILTGIAIAYLLFG